MTRKQAELLKFIADRQAHDGITPSFAEMAVAVSVGSKGSIHRLLTSLEARGFIRRMANRARDIEILRLPEGFRRADAVAEERERCANLAEFFRYPALAEFIRAGTTIAELKKTA